MSSLVGGFMVVMGLAIALTWARDMRSSLEVDRSAGLLRHATVGTDRSSCRTGSSEYSTAIGLVAGGIGLVADAGWAEGVSLVALGALTYTAINSWGGRSRRDRVARTRSRC